MFVFFLRGLPTAVRQPECITHLNSKRSWIVNCNSYLFSQWAYKFSIYMSFIIMYNRVQLRKLLNISQFCRNLHIVTIQNQNQCKGIFYKHTHTKTISLLLFDHMIEFNRNVSRKCVTSILNIQLNLYFRPFKGNTRMTTNVGIQKLNGYITVTVYITVLHYS